MVEEQRLEELKAHLWKAADILRGSIDSVNKDVVKEEQLPYEAERLERSLLADENIHSGWEQKEYAQQEVRKKLKQEYYKVVKKGTINEFAEKVVQYAKDHY